jgi:VIT1/CCC1 family predicted Fe2+/Mn2+ transporter
MMREELGYVATEPNEFRAALTTLPAFLTGGVLPLLVYVYDLAVPGNVDAPSCGAIMAGVAFAVVGGMKSRFVEQAWSGSALETVAVGSLAAALAYAAGSVLEGMA